MCLFLGVPGAADLLTAATRNCIFLTGEDQLLGLINHEIREENILLGLTVLICCVGVVTFPPLLARSFSWREITLECDLFIYFL